MQNQKIGMKILVQGIVQGVGFREAVHKKATGLEVYGTVQNLKDGSVEIVAEGEWHRINKLISWMRCWKGSGHLIHKRIAYTGKFTDFSVAW